MKITQAARDAAEGLSEGAKVALGRHRTGYAYGNYDSGWPEPAHEPASFSKTGRELMRLGLIEWIDRRGSSTRLTPLGLEVKAHLLAIRSKS